MEPGSNIDISDVVYCHGKTHPILLKDVDLCLEIASDFNHNFGFVAEEIVELGILKNLDVSTLDAHRIIEITGFHGKIGKQTYQAEPRMLEIISY